MFALGIARSGFQCLAIFVVFEALLIGMVLLPVFLGPTTVSVAQTAFGHATTRELFPQHHTFHRSPHSRRRCRYHADRRRDCNGTETTSDDCITGRKLGRRLISGSSNGKMPFVGAGHRVCVINSAVFADEPKIDR
jgi:hypothetical protein